MTAPGTDGGPPEREPARAFQRLAPTSVEENERCIADLLGYLVRERVPPSARARAASACAELLDNVLHHAYPDGEGPFRCEAEVAGGEIRIEVADGGRGFDPLAPPAPSEPSTRSPLPARAPAPGGLARARALAEELGLSSAPGRGSCATLRVRAAPAAFDGDEAADLSELDYLPPALARRMLAILRERPDEAGFQLSPALAVVVGRLLSDPTPRQRAESALWSPP